jgi:hypothetical protein
VLKGKEEFGGSFTLQYPENSVYSLAERKIQYESTMKLFQQAEQLAYVYAAQSDLLTQSKERLIKFPKLSKTLTPLVKELETQNGFIAFKGGDFYVATERRLTEEVAELYGTVRSYPGLPGVSQLDRVNSLALKIAEIQKKFDAIKNEKVKKINSSIASDKLVQPLKVLSEQEFKTGTSGPVEPEKAKQLLQQLLYLNH